MNTYPTGDLSNPENYTFEQAVKVGTLFKQAYEIRHQELMKDFIVWEPRLKPSTEFWDGLKTPPSMRIDNLPQFNSLRHITPATQEQIQQWRSHLQSIAPRFELGYEHGQGFQRVENVDRYDPYKAAHGYYMNPVKMTTTKVTDSNGEVLVRFGNALTEMAKQKIFEAVRTVVAKHSNDALYKPVHALSDRWKRLLADARAVPQMAEQVKEFEAFRQSCDKVGREKANLLNDKAQELFVPGIDEDPF